jgi:trigger factor
LINKACKTLYPPHSIIHRQEITIFRRNITGQAFDALFAAPSGLTKEIAGGIMNFQVSDGEKYQKVMEAQIPAEELNFAMRQAMKRLSARLNIPGFRKGKVPQSIIENYVGLDTILSEAAEEVVPRAYVKGLQELALDPVEQPKIEMVQLKSNEPLIFTATFTVKPPVKLGQYLGLPLVKQENPVSEAEIDEDIEKQRRRLSRLIEAEEGEEAALSDVVSIDFEGFHNGIPFEGGKTEKYLLELGSHSLIPGFEEQLIGVKAGEERDVNLMFPQEYAEKSLAGQPVVFKVKVNSLKRRIWPGLDDEFVQEVSETAETMEDLRREVAGRLQKDVNNEADNVAKEEIIAQAAANAEIDIPPIMIEQRVDSTVQELSERLQTQNMELEPFLEHNGLTIEGLRTSYYKQAENAVRGELMLEEVAKAENIQVSEEEVEQGLRALAGYYRQTYEQIKEAFSENGRLELLIGDIKINKASELIFDSADIEHVDGGYEIAGEFGE